MGQNDSDLLEAEVHAALDDLSRRAQGRVPARDTVGLSGSVDRFPERFLAWTWLARRISERYGLSEPLSVTLQRAMIGITHDEEMSRHEHDLAAVLDAQARGDAEQVDARLDAFDSPVSQGPAMQMIVLTTEHVLRDAARKSKRFQTEVLDDMRSEALGSADVDRRDG
jgi:hypothetical protein